MARSVLARARGASGMKTIRNGEAWFSSLDEALADARRQTSSMQGATTSRKLDYASVLGLGAIAVMGWAVVQQFALRR
jgi:hypothetical protein